MFCASGSDLSIGGGQSDNALECIKPNLLLPRFSLWMHTNAVTMPRWSPAGPGTTGVRLDFLPPPSDHSIEERKRLKARAQLTLFLASRDNDTI